MISENKTKMITNRETVNIPKFIIPKKRNIFNKSLTMTMKRVNIVKTIVNVLMLEAKKAKKVKKAEKACKPTEVKNMMQMRRATKKIILKIKKKRLKLITKRSLRMTRNKLKT